MEGKRDVLVFPRGDRGIGHSQSEAHLMAGEGDGLFARGVHALRCFMSRKEVVICSSLSSSSSSSVAAAFFEFRPRPVSPPSTGEQRGTAVMMYIFDYIYR